MAKYVYEVMNPEVMSIAPSDPVERLPGQILALGITGVPVVSEDGAPVGIVSLRDLSAHPEATRADEVMSAPVIVVDQHWDLEAASKLLCEVGLHRLVCVNDEGRVVGVVSAVDLLRGVLGMPARHPDTFPHVDHDTGVVWTDDTEIELEHILAAAPEGPGIILLIHGGRGIPETIVWAETTNNIASRLIDIVSGPQSKAIQRLLDRGNLRYRAARIESEEQRRRTLKSVAHLGRSAHHEA